MIADPDLDAVFDQCLRNIGLNVGKADDEIRLKLKDAVDLGADECRHPRLFAARACRAHGKTRNTDDSVLQPKRVQNLGGFLGQANNTPRITTVHVRSGACLSIQREPH